MDAVIDRDSRQRVAFDNASIANAMSRGVIRCAPDAPLLAVARIMATYNVHAVYVFDDDLELWGMVSDLDIAAAACGEIDGRTAGGSSVTPLQTVMSDQPLAEAAQLMALEGTAHLAVIDPLTRRPVGVVSTLDVARAIAQI
jgi:CBS domain-containing protein